MYRYTLCLIRKNDQWLLLNRQKQPAMGMWNGVGGKSKPVSHRQNPSPGKRSKKPVLRYRCPVRRTILLQAEATVGIYLFLAELPPDQLLVTPLATREGILDWKQLDWILDPDNTGVISNLKTYLPHVLKQTTPQLHTFHYDGHRLLEHHISELEQTIR